MPNRPQKFWDFSIELYGRPGVADACLDLQDSHGFDVNLLLYCFWYGDCLGSFDKLLLEELVKFSLTWNQGIVRPLREVRRWMKNQTQLVSENQAPQFQSLRERIKSEELSAEKIQQEMLEVITLQAIPASSDTGSTAIQANLVQLLKIYELTAEDDVQVKLNEISLAYSLLPVSPSD
ncbi:MAG: TIGR02444 family protein [Proteobacteria bacterium]|nr:TIGR02444 family protein [Pseudomonadota bacterium]